MKLLIIGDLHLKESLGYADYVADRRIPEREEILNFIVSLSSECDGVVMLGDQLDSRNNPSEVITDFTKFVERFNGKEIYIIGGNHELKGDGTSAIDYLGEIKNPKWHIITKDVAVIENMVFCPYFNKPMLGAKDDKEATDMVMRKVSKAQIEARMKDEHGFPILFVHHAISDTNMKDGQTTNLFNEVVLPKNGLEASFKLTIGGHIHTPSKEIKSNVLVAGSVFCNEVGEVDKYIYILDTEINDPNYIPTAYKIPGRGIYKLINPFNKEIEAIPQGSIVKVVITENQANVETLREQLAAKFDAYMLVEQYKDTRTKVDIDKGIIDFSIDSLLEIYSNTKKVDLSMLKRGLELIK